MIFIQRETFLKMDCLKCRCKIINFQLINVKTVRTIKKTTMPLILFKQGKIKLTYSDKCECANVFQGKMADSAA